METIDPFLYGLMVIELSNGDEWWFNGEKWDWKRDFVMGFSGIEPPRMGDLMVI